MPEPIVTCLGCGATKPAPDGTLTDLHPSDHCGKCPPWQCEDCGDMCSAEDLCRCWVRVEDLVNALEMVDIPDDDDIIRIVARLRAAPGTTPDTDPTKPQAFATTASETAPESPQTDEQASTILHENGDHRG